MKILIVVNSLQQGGAERASIRLAESFSGDGHFVSIATWNSKRDFYQLPAGMKRLDLGDFFFHPGFNLPFTSRRFSRVGQTINLVKFRRLILAENPDVVIAFEALVGTITALSLLGTRTPIIVSERINPDPAVYEPHKIAQKLRPFIYKFGVVCSVQTQGYSKWVNKNWNVESLVTPNHIPTGWITNRSPESEHSRKVVSIGRLDPQKGFEFLIKAWEVLGSKTEGWELHIIGRADNQEYLSFLESIRPLNVNFLDATQDVVKILDESAIFVSSSKFEGFPNVVLESLARGIPTVASLSTDIISDLAEAGALLAYEPSDYIELSEHLDVLMSNPQRGSILSQNARVLINTFEWTNVGASWYSAINKAKKIKRRD